MPEYPPQKIIFFEILTGRNVCWVFNL